MLLYRQEARGSVQGPALRRHQLHGGALCRRCAVTSYRASWPRTETRCSRNSLSFVMRSKNSFCFLSLFVSLYVSLSVSLSVCVSIAVSVLFSVSVSLSLCFVLSFSVSVCASPSPSLFLFLCLSLCLCLSVSHV